MKSVRIEHFTHPLHDTVYTEQKKYSIYLGSGYTIKCQSLKDTLRLLSETNKLINNQVDQLLDIAGRLSQISYSLWRYMRHPDKKITDNLLWEFDRTLSLLVERSGFNSGNDAVFQHYRNCCDDLDRICDHLLKFSGAGDGLTRQINTQKIQVDQLRFWINIFPAAPFTRQFSAFIQERIEITPARKHASDYPPEEYYWSELNVKLRAEKRAKRWKPKTSTTLSQQSKEILQQPAL